MQQGADLDRPWVPRPFAPGETVRVLFKGECPSCEGYDNEERHGRLAVVAECPWGEDGPIFGGPEQGGTHRYRHEHADGHDVSVRYLERWRHSRWGEIVGSCLAAIELERVSGLGD